MVKMYCRGQGYTDHHHGDTWGQDVLPRPRVYADHRGDTNSHDVLPRQRVYTYHHHGDTYGQDVLPRSSVYTDGHHVGTRSSCIAEAKVIYRSSSWRHVL